MNSQQQELWSKIREFDIDGGPVSLSFAKRLARENGWSLAFASRVIDEYKRFVFLCMASGHACTPSDQVDQAWHLHLTYTESYWTRFNQTVLPFPLHHGPTKGGVNEANKFEDWYERTKESYRTLFGSEPPTDIWPTSAERFANAAAWKRVDTSKFWMIPKGSLARTTAWAGGALAVLLGGVGCSYLAQSQTNFAPIVIIAVFVIFIAICIAVAKSNANRNGGGSGCSSSGCGSTSSFDGNSGCGSSGCGSSGCGGGGCGGGCGS